MVYEIFQNSCVILTISSMFQIFDFFEPAFFCVFGPFLCWSYWARMLLVSTINLYQEISNKVLPFYSLSILIQNNSPTSKNSMLQNFLFCCFQIIAFIYVNVLWTSNSYSGKGNLCISFLRTYHLHQATNTLLAF